MVAVSSASCTAGVNSAGGYLVTNAGNPDEAATYTHGSSSVSQTPMAHSAPTTLAACARTLVAPPATLVSHLELLHFVDRHQLMGRGLGWVDMHLLASTMASRATIATRDARLARAADALGVAA